MAAIAVRGRRKQSRSGRREAIVPMFVDEQRQTVWSPFSCYAGDLPVNVSLSLPLVSEPSLPTSAVRQLMRPLLRRSATVLLKE